MAEESSSTTQQKPAAEASTEAVQEEEAAPASEEEDATPEASEEVTDEAPAEASPNGEAADDSEATDSETDPADAPAAEDDSTSDDDSAEAAGDTAEADAPEASDDKQDADDPDADDPDADDPDADDPDADDPDGGGLVKRMLEEAVESASAEGDGIPSSDDVAVSMPAEGRSEPAGSVSFEDLDQSGTDVGFTGEVQGRTVTLEDLEREAADERATGPGYDRLRQLVEQTSTNLREQEIVPGRILRVTPDDVVVDIGYKSDGIIDRGEFGERELSPGDEVEVWLEFKEDRDGQLVISKERADRERRWQRVERAYANEEILEGKIIRRIKGGMIAEILDGQMEAFLPGSQIDVRRVRDFEAYLERRMEFKVVKLNPRNENIVISHRALIEEELEEQRKEILEELEVGQVLQGVVKNIVDFGAFVDLGGVDGLLHITDLSWGRVSHPSEVVDLDEEIEVVVLDYEKERQRISLGLKQLTEHPWDNITEKYDEDDVIEGKVVSITNYGAFVELEKGIEGLVHISEMSWTRHIKHPSQMVSLGQLVDVQILNVDEEERKISLGMKQLEPDPWEGISDRYPAGTVMRGTVRNITHFGCFVEIEPGIDGLVHISDLSWTKKIRHPKEVAEKGEEMDVVILNIDEDRKRISLGHKQVQTNPWEQFANAYAEGQDTTGTVARVEKKGIVVELPLEVEAFVPGSELKQGPRDFQDHYQDGEELELRVIRFDRDRKDIVLSEVAKDEAEDRAERREEQQEQRREQREHRQQVSSYQEEQRATGPATLGELSGLGDLRSQMEEAEAAREAEEEAAEGDLADDADVEAAAASDAPEGGQAQADTEATTAEDAEGEELVTGAEASQELEGAPGEENRVLDQDDADSTAQRQEEAGDVTPAEKSAAAIKGAPDADTETAEAAEEVVDDEMPATDAGDEQQTSTSGGQSPEEIESFTEASGEEAVNAGDVKAGDTDEDDTAETEMGEASVTVEAGSDEEADRVARTEAVAEGDVEVIPDDFPHASRLENAGVTTFAELESYDDLTEIDGIGDAYAEDIEDALDEREG